MGCCWDPMKPKSCFYAHPDPRISSTPTNAHTPGFAAGITALVFVLLYAIAAVGYFVMYRR